MICDRTLNLALLNKKMEQNFSLSNHLINRQLDPFKVVAANNPVGRVAFAGEMSYLK